MRLRPRFEYAVAEPQSAVCASGLLGPSRGLPLEKNAGLTGATKTTHVGNAIFLQCALCENHTVRICIVNRGFVQIRTSRVLREVAVPPFSTCETHFLIVKAVVDTTVPADLRCPVPVRKGIMTIIMQFPIAGRPHGARVEWKKLPSVGANRDPAVWELAAYLEGISVHFRDS